MVDHSEVRRVHITSESAALFELTPPHDPRTVTTEYARTHHLLTQVQDSPCIVCGVRQSTLTDPLKNIFGAKQMETHHYPIERSLMDACDPAKVHLVYPQVVDQASLLSFVDSVSNCIVLCDIDHRSLQRGIHHLLTQDFVILPFLYSKYQIVSLLANQAVALEVDSAIEAIEHPEEKTPEPPLL